MTTSLPDLPVEELEEGGSSEGKGLNFRPYLRTFIRKAWLIGGLTCLTTLGAWIWSSQDAYTYTGNFFLLVEPITASGKLTNPTTLTRTEGVPRDDLFALDYPTNLVFLTSPGMTFKIAQKVQEKERIRKVPAIWKDLRDNLKVDRAQVGQGRGSETKIFQVSYTGEDPQEVQTILQTAADTFLEYSSEDRETNIKAGVKFIDEQLPNLQQRLEKLKARQKQLRQNYELIDPLPKNQEVLTQISTLEQQKLTLNTQLQAQKKLANSLQQQLKLSPDEAFAAAILSQDPTRVALLSQLQQIDSQIAVASATFTENSPQVQDLREQRQNVDTLLNQTTQEIITKNELSVSSNSNAFEFQDPTRLGLIQQLLETTNQIKTLQAQLDTIEPTKQQLEQQVKRYPNLINEYSDLERQIQLTEEILNKLLLQRETLKVEAAQELPWQLISEPQIPLDADGSPIGAPPSRKKKLLAGAMAGILLGAAMAFLWEKRQNFFYTAEDISQLLGIPLLGEIPKDDRAILSEGVPLNHLSQTKPDIVEPVLEDNHHGTIEEEALFLPSQESSFLEAFDDLYLQLYLQEQGSNLRSVMISSAESEDGCSTIAVNLATNAAQKGQQVLLVDTNFSNPQLHNLLNVSNHKGLIDVLGGQVSPQAIIESVRDIENLFVLPMGEHLQPSLKHLWSPKFNSLMEELGKTYDLVIYDTPPFFLSSDIKFMAKQTDGIILVATIQKTSQSLLKRAVKEIRALNLPLLGAVANHRV
ncbi:putative lipopolysaccharide biosynthesis [Crocosphaera subtropica ATCC 51142]|uniref:Lipopolysaccharide biosynthesis n=1 Tax=Crocosphaera subtropica (strain ATCC 51142 / BH68) TaxID=43989 RepID=B1WX74_CROS5|nr:polysaccharide biosynthesis tyrosine autokinase [Crocosphaera subtropica]ACB50818.1 putative lipopolysaccharide biosynthesis [Crocosphaera subtropica ATCC 51142]